METLNLFRRDFLSALVAIGATIGLGGNQAIAMPIDYDFAQIQLNELFVTPTGDLSFVPDGNFEGSFTYDNDTRTFSSLAFTVSGTSIPSLNGFYDTFEGFSVTNVLNVSRSTGDQTARLNLDFGFPGPLTDPAIFPPALFDVTASIGVGFCFDALGIPCGGIEIRRLSNFAVATDQPADTPAIPLPATLPLLVGGLAALLFAGRGQRRRLSRV